MINHAGGFGPDADINNIELSSFNDQSGKILPGGQIFVPALNNYKNMIKLSGEIEQPREISYHKELYLSDIINNVSDFKSNANLNFSVIERAHSIFDGKKYYAFSPMEVLAGNQNFPIMNGDKIYIYSNIETKNLIEKFSFEDKNFTPDYAIIDNSNIPEPAGSY